MKTIAKAAPRGTASFFLQKENMNQQLQFNGRMYDVKDGWIQMDRESLTKIRLEEIPSDVSLRCDRTLERWIDIGGVRNLGAGKAQVFIRFALGETAETLLSDYACEKGMQILINKRAETEGDIRYLEDIVEPVSPSIVWAGITVSGVSMEELFEKAIAIADEIVTPFSELESCVDRIIFNW